MDHKTVPLSAESRRVKPLDRLETWLRSKLKRNSGPLVSNFAKGVISEAAKTAATIVIGHTAVASLGESAGTISKDLVERLLKRTSEVEKKIDLLVSEPLKVGLDFLSQAARHKARTREQIASRDAILDAAHISFTRAHALVANSREDSIFVRALDCHALADRTGRLALAKEELADLHRDLNVVRESLDALEQDATKWIEDANKARRFLGRQNDLNERPIGHEVQIIWVRKYEKDARRLQAQAKLGQDRFSFLAYLVSLAEAVVMAQTQ